MDKKYKVYKITTPDGMVYFGYTGENKVEYRWRKHIHQNTSLTPYIKKYGFENLIKEVVEDELTKQEAIELEGILIDEYKEKGCCINKMGSGGEEMLRDRCNEYHRRYREWHKKEISEKNRRWREEHKEEKKKKDREYYEKNRDKVLEQVRVYREEHKEECNERDRRWKEKNKEHLREIGRKYREEHKEKIREYLRCWREAHKEYLKEYRKRQREKKMMDINK